MTTDDSNSRGSTRSFIDHRIPPPVVALALAVLMFTVARMTASFAMSGVLRVLLAGMPDCFRRDNGCASICSIRTRRHNDQPRAN